jgi:hypothetical protein
VWSKAGRFVEGLHAVGGIITKISANCVINLHVALLFTCLFLWVYLMHGYNYLYFYGYLLYMLHVYAFFYFSMNLCIYRTYLSVYILYIKLLQKCCVCICFDCMHFEKVVWHSLVWMLGMLQHVPQRRRKSSLA